MNLKEQIKSDFIEAMKKKNTQKKMLLSVILGEIENEERRGNPSTDETVLNIVKRMEKSLKQTNTAESLTELEMIKRYLPELMGFDEIKTIIETLYTQKGLNNVGSLMKEFNNLHNGKADNKLVVMAINQVIKK